MNTRLRSAVQFAALDRKIRTLGKLAAGQRSSAMLASVKPGLVEFLSHRSRLSSDPAPDSVQVTRGVELAADYPKKRVSELSLSDLTGFQSLLLESETARLRTSSEKARHEGEVMPAEMIPRALERFFDWVSSAAFAEMHPIEQMTLCQIRLSEIAPFERFSTVTCDLFSFLTLNLGAALLPSYTASDVEAYERALEDALRLVITNSLVDLNVEACERTCDALAGLF